MRNIPASNKSRHFIADRIKKARDLRNRVFHHEAIYHLPGLDHEHDMLRTFARWLYPNFAILSLSSNRFEAVYQQGTDPYYREISQLIVKLAQGDSKKL